MNMEAPIKSPEEKSEIVLVAEQVQAMVPELKRIADAVQPKSESIWHRLLSGLLFGLGTALGATVVTAVVLFMLSRVISYLGLDEALQTEAIKGIIERRIEKPIIDPGAL